LPKPGLSLSEVTPLMTVELEREGDTAILDTETWPILPALKAPKVVCLQFKTRSEGPVLATTLDSMDHAMRDILGHDRIVGFTTDYDMMIMGNTLPHLLKPIFKAYEDLRVRDVRLSAQMDELRHGYENHKTDVQTRYFEVDGLPVSDWPDEHVTYAKEDINVTERIDRVVPDQPDEEYQAQAAFALRLASCWGVRTDGAKVAKLEKALRYEFIEQSEACKKLGLVRANGSKNTKRVIEIVEESWRALYDEDPPKTKSGKTTSIERVILQGCKNPDLEPYIRRQRAEKGLSTYIPYMQRGTKQPICFAFNPIVATGRSSSFDPNGQNIFAFGGYRPCFVPRPGHVFIIADYAINELRCLAQIQYDWFGESDLGDVIREGRDPHAELGALIFDMSVEDIVQGRKAGDPQARLARDTAKGPNFGFPGGMGPGGIRMYVMRNTGKRGTPIVLTLAECRRHKKLWLKRWSQMKDYFEKIRGQNGFGVLARTGFQRGGMDYCANSNFHFQGLAAAGFKRAHFEVARRAYTEPDSALFGCRVWLALHDELFLESRKKKAEAAARELKQVMEDAMNKLTPGVLSKADAKVCDYWEEK